MNHERLYPKTENPIANAFRLSGKTNVISQDRVAKTVSLNKLNNYVRHATGKMRGKP